MPAHRCPMWRFMGLALLVAAGCTKATVPPVAPAPDSKEEQKENTDSQVVSSHPSASSQSTETPDVSTTSPSDAAASKTAPASSPQENAPSTSDAASQLPTSTPAESEKGEMAAQKTPLSRDDMVRVIAFTPGGLLLIDVAVLLDGEPLAQARTEAIDRIFRTIDEDQDGRITWEQFIEHPHIKSGIYGNTPMTEGRSVKEIKETYDVARNDRVDREELPRFFSDDRGATRAFSILAPARPTGAPGEDSVILAWLDADRDGQLSMEELADARARLRIRDANDDGILSRDELSPMSDSQMPGMMSGRRPATGPPSGMMLGANPRWDSLNHYLQEIYSGVGRPLRTGHFFATPQLAERIDGNKDGRISAIELQNLENAPADVVLTLSYISQPNGDNATPKFEASPLANDWAKYQSTWKQEGLRAEFQADDYTITLAMADLVGESFRVETVKAAFAEADADKNGYLEEMEYGRGQLIPSLNVAQADQDGDGKLFLEEVLSLVALRTIVAGSQAVIKLESANDPFLDLLDQNDDGQINQRELREAESRLAKLDKDGDGFVTLGELPQSMRMTVVRGIVDQNTDLPETPRILASSGAVDAPLWFLRMDANGDGEISEIEFIGTAEQFAVLDKDQNGVIAVEEVATEMTGAAAPTTETP